MGARKISCALHPRPHPIAHAHASPHAAAVLAAIYLCAPSFLERIDEKTPRVGPVEIAAAGL